MKYIMYRLVALVLCIGIFSTSVSSVAAQTTTSDTSAQMASLLQMIQVLQAQLAALQAQQVTSATTGDVLNPPSLAGRRMQTRAEVRIRTMAGISGQIIGTAKAGAVGTVKAGPIEKDGHTWWKIYYDSGVTGWSVGEWLQFLPATSNPVLLPVSVSVATCSLDSNKAEYVVEEPVTISWNTNKATKVAFDDKEANSALGLTTGDQNSFGTKTTRFTKTGTYTLSLVVSDSSGATNRCTRLITVLPATVKLLVNGIDTTSYTASVFDSLQVENRMQGDIKSCELRGEYEFGTITIPKQTWNTTLLYTTPDGYGRGYFSAVAAWQGKKYGQLKHLNVTCSTKYAAIQDQIDVNVTGDDTPRNLKVSLNGRIVYSQTGVTEVEAYASCLGEVDKHQYSSSLVGTDVMSCEWGGSTMKTINGWKG